MQKTGLLPLAWLTNRKRPSPYENLSLAKKANAKASGLDRQTGQQKTLPVCPQRPLLPVRPPLPC